MARILVAEDDDAMRQFLAVALARSGHDVVAVGDGESATRNIEQDNYDLLFWFTDGGAALEKARELVAMPDLGAVFAARREKLLRDKIDVTPWLVDLVNRLLADPHCRPTSHT